MTSMLILERRQRINDQYWNTEMDVFRCEEKMGLSCKLNFEELYH